MRALALLLTALVLAGPAAAADADGYVCPMHPHYHADEPGTCPVCGMDLVAAPGLRDATATAHHGHGDAATVIAVAPEMIQTMGVRTAPAAVTSFGRTVRAFGHVAPSTRLESVAASRVEGWIEDLTVTAEGDRVPPGGLLYRVYSPDLVAAQQDYLAALRSQAPDRLASAARRLRSLGVQASVVDSMTKRRELIETVPVYAEAGGVVSMLAVREGAYVKPGDTILQLQAYDEVWIIAAIAEKDLAGVAAGANVSVGFPAASIAPRSGQVDYVYPTVEPDTRTGRVRIVLDNRDGHLRPGTYADVRLAVTSRERLSVPSEAILWDSSGAHVIVALGRGRFAARAVTTGIEARGRTEVLDGLDAGEPVVVSGQFLLDSETRLREGFDKLAPPASDAAGVPADPASPAAAASRRPARHATHDER